ncbi:hypothetical protein VTI74DRAFT_3337 [Chaetomium olivicolor]
MGYHWEQHRQTCYRLYVEQNMSLDEVVEYMRVHHDFTPSRRAFQGAFSRWGFPNKLNPAYKNEQLVARVKELWENNYNQKDIVRTLVDEGYDIGDREVTRIRLKNGWLMRTNVGYGNESALRQPSQGADAHGEQDKEGEGEGKGEGTGGSGSKQGSFSGQGHDGYAEDRNDSYNNYYGYQSAEYNPADAQVQEETLAAMREARREYRKRQYELEAHERWMNKKRRRHTKPYAGLPADPPGPPRFPSETTLTECKEILQLDADAYKTVREKFYNICTDAGVYKKTICGPERWEALKDQLIRESMHLRAVFWDPADVDKKKLAVEIIACDVTKRIRVENNQVKMAEAKTILGLNPQQARAIRGQLYNILAQEKFTSKLEEGLEYFEALKQRWIAGSEELTRIVAAGPSDPDYQRKMKAINVLCRDANRRYHDDVFRKGKTPAILLPPEERPPLPKYRQPKVPKPKAKKAAAAQPASTSASESVPDSVPEAVPDTQHGVAATERPAPATGPKRRGRPKGSRNRKKDLPHAEFRLVLASPDPGDQQQQMESAQPMTDTPIPPMPPLPDIPNPFTDDTYAQAFASSMQARALHQQQRLQQRHQQSQQRRQRSTATPSAPPPEPEPKPQVSSTAIAVFFRLHPSSVAMFPAAPKQWISALDTRSLAELRAAAQQKVPGSLCYKIEGIVKDGRGGELPLPVSDDGELETYLQHVEGQAPTFCLRMIPE